MLRAFLGEVGRLEETPPWRWDRPAPSLAAGRRSWQRIGPFWWLRNPLGKMMVRSAVPFTWPVLQHYVYRSHELKARYDLVRLLARARLAAGPGMSWSRRRCAACWPPPRSATPSAARPTVSAREQGCLYSVGPDRDDDDGREAAGTVARFGYRRADQVS